MIKEGYMARGRHGYSVSQNTKGEFVAHIEPQTAKRLERYCRIKNLTKTQFVNDSVAAQLSIVEKEIYKSMTREELIEILLTI